MRKAFERCLDSSKASEEAVQNPQHNYSKWTIPRANLGSEKWGFPCDQSGEQCSIQHQPPLVPNGFECHLGTTQLILHFIYTETKRERRPTKHKNIYLIFCTSTGLFIFTKL